MREGKKQERQMRVQKEPGSTVTSMTQVLAPGSKAGDRHNRAGRAGHGRITQSQK